LPIFALEMTDSFQTFAGPSTGSFKDRGSKFLGYGYPVQTEALALEHLEALRKEHFKAAHHCFAWRLGTDGLRFRANDDGEPGGTAGKPILGQLDAFQVTNAVVVVVRYFGGTLLGASGLINAYRECAADTLRNAELKTEIVKDFFILDFDYALMPDVMTAVKKPDIEVLRQEYGDRGLLEIGIRKSAVADTLLRLRAGLWKVGVEEASTLGWPAGLVFKVL
jgi:uncharacterized YigZ family protein